MSNEEGGGAAHCALAQVRKGGRRFRIEKTGAALKK